MPIVTVNLSQTVAPAPSLLQKTGAMVSQGATTLGAGVSTLLRSAADLTPILKGALALASLTWNGSVVTGAAAAAHGIPNGDIVTLTISGVTPAAYNGTFQATSTGGTGFTYPLVSNPGATTVLGSYTPEDVAELFAMVTTFFAQGSQQAVYVLELGVDGVPQGVTALAAYITANPGVFYSYLVPRGWGVDSSFRTMLANYSALTAKTYFHVTTTLGAYASFLSSLKNVLLYVEAPSIPVTEFSAAAGFFVSLNYKPAASNRVTPFGYAYLYGVTPYPKPGNSTLLAAMEVANVNFVGTGSEGGISTSMLVPGNTLDGNDFSYWYAVDWVQINSDTGVSAAVINGSNNSQNPLYYNQQGIDRLQATESNILAQGASFGLVLGAPISVSMSPSDFTTAVQNGVFAGQSAINAYNFIDYSKANPNDYAAGLYTGLQVAFIPQRGFKHITISVNVSQFVAS